MADPVPGSAASLASVTSVVSEAASVATSAMGPSEADLAWSLTKEDGTVDLSATVQRGWGLQKIRESLGEGFKATVKEHGGTMQFLESRYPTKEAKAEYAKKLWAEFPPLDSTFPMLCDNPPACKEEDRMAGRPGASLFFHLAQLDFSAHSSLRGPPALRTCCLLADEILTDGFVTMGDPLLVTCKEYPPSDKGTGPWSSQDQGQPTAPAFAMASVKGSARICTLHTLVTLLFDEDLSVSEARWPCTA
jgi:hypothetical protein